MTDLLERALAVVAAAREYVAHCDATAEGLVASLAAFDAPEEPLPAPDEDQVVGEQPDLWPGLRDIAQAIDDLVAARSDVHCPNFGPHLFSDANVCIRCGTEERP